MTHKHARSLHKFVLMFSTSSQYSFKPACTCTVTLFMQFVLSDAVTKHVAQIRTIIRPSSRLSVKYSLIRPVI